MITTGREERRTGRIEPYFIAFKWSAWYVLGYCGQREDFRLFKLNRLWNLRVTDELYQPREVPEEQRGLEGWLQSEQTLTALFDPAVEYRLIEDYGPASYEPAEDGRLRLTVSYANRDYIVSWLLGFGELAEVVAPGDLRAEVARRGGPGAGANLFWNMTIPCPFFPWYARKREG